MDVDVDVDLDVDVDVDINANINAEGNRFCSRAGPFLLEPSPQLFLSSRQAGRGGQLTAEPEGRKRSSLARLASRACWPVSGG